MEDLKKRGLTTIYGFLRNIYHNAEYIVDIPFVIVNEILKFYQNDRYYPYNCEIYGIGHNNHGQFGLGHYNQIIELTKLDHLSSKHPILIFGNLRSHFFLDPSRNRSSNINTTKKY